MAQQNIVPRLPIQTLLQLLRFLTSTTRLRLTILLTFFSILSPVISSSATSTTRSYPSSHPVSSTIQKGFNYASTTDFSSNFTMARSLNFTSARLYTMIEPSTTADPISAIPAAISTNTTLLLGLWASAGSDAFSSELSALESAISTYKQPFVNLIVGISVGSEDLYRYGSQQQTQTQNPGVNADTISSYVDRTREVLHNTENGIAEDVPIGHVDTWGIWRDFPGIETVIEKIDWIGMNTFPYWQSNDDNSPSNGKSLFDEAYQATLKFKKEVWITETGFPVLGNRSGESTPSTNNAQKYWRDVGCGELFGSVNTWWYTLQDEGSTGSEPSFGIVGKNGSVLFDLSCKGVGKQSDDDDTETSSASSSTSSGANPQTGAGTATTTLASATANAAAGSRWKWRWRSADISPLARSSRVVKLLASATFFYI
ncbi:MAG: hypothetical protein Q9190_001601 [Brigantiaea leucoxantha]